MAQPRPQQKLSEKRRREKAANIVACWEARKNLTVENAEKVTPADIDAAFDGLVWEKQYKVSGKGNAVSE